MTCAPEENYELVANSLKAMQGSTELPLTRDAQDQTKFTFTMSAVSYLDIDKPALRGQLCAVTFAANGGEGEMAPQGMVIGRATELNANTFTNGDLVFKCWSTNENGGGTKYKDRQSVTLSGDVTLYAQWRQSHEHSFTYSAKGAAITAKCTGEGTCDITEGLKLTISAPTKLSYNGKAKTASLSTGYNTTAFPGTYRITYKQNGKTVSTAKNAGTYTASVTVGKATASVQFTIAQAGQQAPAAPVVTKTTGTSITVKAVKGEEYKISGSGKWQSGGTFNNLTPGKQYSTVTRKAAGGNAAASKASAATKARTLNYTILMQTSAMTVEKGKTITAKWGKVPGATDYDVYVQYCGKDFGKDASKSGQYKAKKAEHAKTSVRAKVEHVFGVVKQQL